MKLSQLASVILSDRHCTLLNKNSLIVISSMDQEDIGAHEGGEHEVEEDFLERYSVQLWYTV